MIQQKRWYRTFKKNKQAMFSLVFLGFIILFSFTAELWSNNKPIVMSWHQKIYFPVFKNYHPSLFFQQNIFVTDYRKIEFSNADWAVWPLNQWDPFESNSQVSHYPSPPSWQNWLGTDDRGRDVFSRLLYGFRYTIIYAFAVWFFSYLIGTVWGGCQGYFGGKWDLIGSRFVEVFELMPQLLLLITLISIFEPSIFLLVVFSVVFDWTGIYHYMRAQFLQLRRREYVESAKVLGANHWQIIFKHILPNAITPLITFSPFSVAANISGLALLDYLGLGMRAPTPSWGELMAQSQKYFTVAEWLVWAPSIALLLVMVSLIHIGLAIKAAIAAEEL